MSKTGCAVAILLLAIAPLAVLNGWAITVLWGWFVVPVFGIAVPSLPNAIGFALLVGLFRTSSTSDDDDADIALIVAKGLGRAIARPLLAVAFGFVVQAVR